VQKDLAPSKRLNAGGKNEKRGKSCTKGASGSKWGGGSRVKRVRGDGKAGAPGGRKEKRTPEEVKRVL